MVIRAKNPNQNIKPVSFTGTRTTVENQKSNETKAPSDVNEIHQAHGQRDFKAIKAETTLSRPGFHFLSQSIAHFIDEQALQTKKAQGLKTQIQNATSEPMSEKLINQWQQLQPEMAQTRKKLKQLQRKEKWLQAGIIDHKQIQVGQKWVDNSERIAQMSGGAPKDLAALTHQIEMMQQTPGLSQLGIRLSIAEAGALSRHELGGWLPSSLPSHVLTKSVLDILTQSNVTLQSTSPTAQWLEQGNGGANLSRLQMLSEPMLTDQKS